MKTKILLSAFAIFILFFCSSANSEVIKQERKVNQFSKIDLSIAAHVYLKQGNTQSVVVEANNSYIGDIKTVVNNKILLIKTDKWMLHYKEVNIYITMSNIESLDISGSGRIETLTSIKTTHLNLNVSGSGRIHIPELNATNVSSDISGSGRINLEGKSNISKLNFDISGSGKFTCTEQAQNVSAGISGSGTGDIFATKNLSVNISGSGKVYYKGKPLINCDISGSGKLIENN